MAGSKLSMSTYSQVPALSTAISQVIWPRAAAVSPGFVETPLTDKNDFDMPMKISSEEAAKAMLKGIESHKQTVFFPRVFGLMLRFMHVLPQSIQKRLSLSMREK